MPSLRLARALAALEPLVDWERRDRRGMCVSLAPMDDLMQRLGSPHRTFRAVHVTGTKGKGTTAALIAEGLRRAGIRTGLYTSPHQERVTERVRIDGLEVADDELASAIEDALAVREAALLAGTPATEATWFDILTAAAFQCFSRANTAWVVVEVGIGGRLDSTNVIFGEVCVVTNVDLEHVQVLGSTRAAIAREKGGILKRGSTLVTGVFPAPGVGPDDDAARVLDEIAGSLGVEVLRPARRAERMLDRNVDLARLVLDELGRRGVERTSAALLDPDAIRSARLGGRQELRSAQGVPVLLDGAHVASSIAAVLREAAADSRLPRRKPVVVLALGRDKDADLVLKTLREGTDRLLCTSTASGSLRAAGSLVEDALRLGIDAETASEPASALARATQLAADGGWILVTGSFHLLGAVRPLLDVPTNDPPSRC